MLVAAAGKRLAALNVVWNPIKASTVVHAAFAALVILVMMPQSIRAQSAETASPVHEGFIAHVAPDGSVSFEDRHVGVGGLGITFDITDELMRSQGIDPYSSAKLAFLDATRDSRVAMGREYRLRQLAHSAELMQTSINEAWSLRDPSQRKQTLFELWDAAAETGEPELVAGGQAARATLIAFIQANLTGNDAYTREELAQLNASRTSRLLFDPYRDEVVSLK